MSILNEELDRILSVDEKVLDKSYHEVLAVLRPKS
jgi:hypothetical protein